jgi:hypothetical protein
MPRRVHILQRVIEHKGIAVQCLRVGEVGHEGVRRDEAAKFGVVEARPEVHEPQPHVALRLKTLVRRNRPTAHPRFAKGVVARLGDAIAAGI